MGLYVDALKRHQEQRTTSPEGCGAKMLWKCVCLEHALRMAKGGTVNDDMLAK